MRFQFAIAILSPFIWLAGGLASADLVSDFQNPPDSAKPWVYWWWLDSNVSAEGITRDLEEMKRQGIAGALVFDAGEGHTSPVGPRFMSREWLALFKHAAVEGDRLGLQLSFNICSGWNAGGEWVTPDLAIKKLTWSNVKIQGGGEVAQDLPMPPAAGGYYKDVAVLAYTHGDGERLASSYVTLTDKMDASDRLTWDAPAGTWSVFRFGATIHGNDYEKKTKCASRGAQGYEIDFYSKSALDLQFAQTAGKVLAEIGDLAGKTVTYLHDDSWECGEPTWTPAMREEFSKRRGYDMFPYLPVLAGAVVDSEEVSARFMRDFKRTLADLLAENHYAYFSELAAKHGMGIHPESGGPFFTTAMDPLMNLGRNDIPMGEFWIRRTEPDGPIAFADQYAKCDSVKQAASAAHVYGKKLCQAEALTNMGRNWEEAPYMLKDLADRALCAGLTRHMLCFYVHQPYLDIKPGYEWPEAGTHFDRNITWWDQMDSFTAYLSRCQFLLQQGLFVADVCYFAGDDAGAFVPAKTQMNPALPPGYDCDTINGEVLMTRMQARDGRLVLPDGMSYRLLVLPPRDSITPESLAKIAELVEAGATVVGQRPLRSSSLTGYPRCDDKVKALAERLWGAGRVVVDKPLAEILQSAGVSPDFSCTSPGIDYIHRRDDTIDIYFVANPKDAPETADCTFRVSGRLPELWDPLTGTTRGAQAFTPTSDGRTTVPIEFAPRGSIFVVFRKPIAPAQNGTTLTNFPPLSPVMTIGGPWEVKFDPKWGGPESVEFSDLVDWTQRPEDGIKYYSGKATYFKTFQLPEPAVAHDSLLYLDLGELHHLAEVRLNGKDLGVLWTKPFRVDLSEAATAGENKLEIDIINLWPNRLIGDSKLPAEKRVADQRYTKTNVTKFDKGDHALLESGLLGPVTVLRAQRPF